MNQLYEKVQKINIELTDRQLKQFQFYYDMLIETNKVMNLTAITEKEEVITKHFLDSLALAEVYPDICNPELKLTVLDLGTGAGFPGIPLKIAFPHLRITLMDSLNKRVKFLQSVIDKLELCDTKKLSSLVCKSKADECDNELNICDITAVHGRAEEAAKNVAYREQFDLCVSRAVANLATLSEYCIPFVKPGGKCISYKAAEVEEEVEDAKEAIHILGGKLSTVKKIVLPDTDIERSFVFIDKIKNTPKAYPRKAGMASKEPLKKRNH